MSLKPLTDEQNFKSYKAYEAYLEKEVKAGSIRKEQARLFLQQAKKNYSNNAYNRNLEKARCA